MKPIIDLTGAHEFNEVFFDNVRLPANALLGVEGEGWTQATAELSLERSGPERYLSSMVLFLELVRHAQTESDPALAALVGRLAAEAWTLRLMSASVAAKLARGEDPALEATIVKDLGNCTNRRSRNWCRRQSISVQRIPKCCVRYASTSCRSARASRFAAERARS